MPIWAIVPVKPFHRSKSRLSALLSPKEREAFSRESLTHTLSVLGQVPAISDTLVISRDPAALALARKFDAKTVTESGAPELNPALARAVGLAAAFGAGAVLILPADLPLVKPEEIRHLLAEDGGCAGVVIAPDRRGEGTNALFMRPPGKLKLAYGRGSFARHQSLARQRGLPVRVCRLPGIELDVDLPEDLELYRAISNGNRLPEAADETRLAATATRDP